MVSKRSILSAAILISFLFTTIIPANRVFALESTLLTLPKPGTMVAVSQPLVPVMLKGLQINPKNPLIVDFLVSKGDEVLGQAQYYKEIETLARYFLASMAIPEDQLWVNLSPFEKDKIITDPLSQTEMGQNMLAQDYLLKQLTASMIYPEKSLGKEFWSRIYEQAKNKTGNANIPVNTFNKVWILADTANAVEKGNTVMITDAHLKVMLEEDYLAAKKHDVVSNNENSRIIRELIIPELEKEVNTGKNFAPLRQIFNAFVLSVWYKQNLKQSILNQVYADKTKLGGIEAKDRQAKQKIYERYIQAYKKGVFNYIREDKTQGVSQPRKYFSGGEVISAQHVKFTRDAAMFAEALTKPLDRARVEFDAAMRSDDRGNFLSVIDNANTDNLPEAAVAILEQRAKDITTSVITKNVIEETQSLGIPVNIRVKEIADQDNVYNAENIIQNGYIIEYSNDINREKGEGDAVIYVTSSFRKKIADNNGLFYFYVRKILKIYETSGNAGRQKEVDFIKAKIEDEKQRLNGRAKIEKSLALRIPPESFPWVLLEREANALLINPTLSKEQRSPEYFKERVKHIFPNRKFKKIVVPGTVAFEASQEAYRLMKNNANLKLINAMDGVANYADTIPSTVKGMMDRLKEGKPITFAFGASKYNPSSIAHISVTLDGTFAQTGASSYIVNVTLEDVRKPSVKKSAKSRLKLAKADIEGIFKNLFTILDVSEPINGYDLGKYNGEEVFFLIIKMLIPYGLQGPQYYVAGEDHYFIFAPLGNDPQSKFIQWDLMENENVRQHYTFYASEFNGDDWKTYQELVRRQVVLSKNLGPSTEARSFYSDEDSALDRNVKEGIINGIIQAKTKERLLDVMNAASTLPRFDTAGKAVAINLEHDIQKSSVKAVLVLPHRQGARGHDSLRDQLVEEKKLIVMPMEGIKHAVSATTNRKFLEQILTGVFDYNYGYGLTMETMENMNKDPEIFRILVRQSGVKLPLALPLLMPEPSELKDSVKQKDFELKRELLKLGAHHEEGTTPAGDESYIKVFDAMGKEAVFVEYYIVNGLDEHEGGRLKDKNTVEYTKITVNKESPNGQKILKLIEDYVKHLNDAAMVSKDIVNTTRNENNVGGIELNRKDLNLNVTKEGQGLQFEMDPVLLEELKSDNFGGFRPTVLSITPLRASPALN